MKKKQFKIVILFVVAYVSILMANDKKIVLQNGLDNYSGCKDSYIVNSMNGINFDDSNDVEFRYDPCWGNTISRVVINFDLTETEIPENIMKVELALYGYSVGWWILTMWITLKVPTFVPSDD